MTWFKSYWHSNSAPALAVEIVPFRAHGSKRFGRYRRNYSTDRIRTGMAGKSSSRPFSQYPYHYPHFHPPTGVALGERFCSLLCVKNRPLTARKVYNSQTSTCVFSRGRPIPIQRAYTFLPCLTVIFILWPWEVFVLLLVLKCNLRYLAYFSIDKLPIGTNREVSARPFKCYQIQVPCLAKYDRYHRGHVFPI